MKRPSIRFTADHVQHASDSWGMNCGPGAICAIAGMNPEEIRPFLADFESKRYMNPTMAASILKNIGIGFSRTWENNRDNRPNFQWPSFGICRIQWEGPWTKKGVPIAARYRKTHWIARDDDGFIFDINSICVGGWIPFNEWSTELVPWLWSQCEPKATGWWLTHSWDVHHGPANT